MVNRRSDEFGGSLENRMRFLRMVYEEIRSQVGADYPLGIRYTIDEDHKDGLSFAEAVTVANRLEPGRAGRFLQLQSSAGSTTRLNLLVYNIPDMTAASAPWLRQVGTFKAETSLRSSTLAKLADVRPPLTRSMRGWSTWSA